MNKIILISTLIISMTYSFAEDLQSKMEPKKTKIIEIAKKDFKVLENNCTQKVDYAFSVIEQVNITLKEKSIKKVSEKYILDNHPLHFDIRQLRKKYKKKRNQEYFNDLLKILREYSMNDLNRCILEIQKNVLDNHACLSKATNKQDKAKCTDEFTRRDSNILGSFFSKLEKTK